MRSISSGELRPVGTTPTPLPGVRLQRAACACTPSSAGTTKEAVQPIGSCWGSLRLPRRQASGCPSWSLCGRGSFHPATSTRVAGSKVGHAEHGEGQARISPFAPNGPCQFLFIAARPWWHANHRGNALTQTHTCPDTWMWHVGRGDSRALDLDLLS